MTGTDSGRRSLPTAHVDDVRYLLDFATRSTVRTDLVLTPEQLHARNLKQRLAAQRQPRSSLGFHDLTTLTRDLLSEAGVSTTALDRMDRIRALEGLADDHPDALSNFIPLFGRRVAQHATDIETVRATVDAITGYDDRRLETLSQVAERLPAVARRDADDYVRGAVAAERLLSETQDAVISGDALLREATALIRESDGRLFEEVYPDVERLHLAGVSSVDATLRALLLAVAEETAVDVHLSLRTGTGPRIAGRLCDGEATAWDDDALPRLSPDVPVTELAATTREAEARVALATVTRLLDEGISPSDVVVVARDVRAYERSLERAARHYGQPLSVWTQLAVTETQPYTLVASVCDLLDARERGVSLETLFAPLYSEWVDPTRAETTDLPLLALDRARQTLEEAGRAGQQSVAAWRAAVDETAIPPAVGDWLQSLLAWAADQPADPTPSDVERTLEPLVERYRDVVLPRHRERDDGTLSATTETARALVRVDQLVGEVERKYEEWLSRDQTDWTWESVGYLFETIATVKPGRREHANAAVVDVVDATDTWGRTVPYVVAVGLVDGMWPLEPDGLLPVELRDALLAGEADGVRELSVREGWTAAREFDHFVDAVSTATELLVCTRHEQSADGSPARRSRFFEALEPTPTRVEPTAVRALSSSERTLPEPLAGVVGGTNR